MNRGLTISGAITLGLAILIPLFMLNAAGGWEDELFVLIIGVPIAFLAGLLGLVLLIVGLASGERGQQQQQQIVVVTGGAFCNGCGQPRGNGAFCSSCGAAA